MQGRDGNMIVELSGWLQLVLWGNLLVMAMTLLTLVAVRRDRKTMERAIITLAKNKRR